MDFFGENEEILDLLKSIIRVGEIHSVNYENATARVHFPDDDELVSYDMQILHRNTLKNKDYNMPDIGEDVLCLCLPSGLASGFILGSVYAGNITPPESIGDKRTVIFEDGSRFSYDRKIHQFDAQIESTTVMVNRQDIVINTPHDVTITAANAVNVTGVNNVTVNTKIATVNATAAYILNTASATLNAPAITLNGNVQVSGTLTAGKDVIADRISLINHVHNGNQGSPTSAPLKPQ